MLAAKVDVFVELHRQKRQLASQLEQIQQAAERAAGLTHQLLAFSRKQVMQPIVLDLHTVVNEMRRMLGRLIGENIELKNQGENVAYQTEKMLKEYGDKVSPDTRGQIESALNALRDPTSIAYQHSGRGNFCYFDGHVESHSPRELMDTRNRKWHRPLTSNDAP